jgi:transcriptional regulator with XRE-family HTH domain
MKALSITHQKLGEMVKRLRRENNMTQEDLADKIQVDRSYMGFIERGERNISLEKIVRICKVLNIKIQDLFNF